MRLPRKFAFGQGLAAFVPEQTEGGGHFQGSGGETGRARQSKPRAKNNSNIALHKGGSGSFSDWAWGNAEGMVLGFLWRGKSGGKGRVLVDQGGSKIGI